MKGTGDRDGGGGLFPQLLVSLTIRCALFEISMRRVQIDISPSSFNGIKIFQLVQSEEGRLFV